ncbi:hypothetical protein M569_14316, partial [Genlisea aurea]
SKRGWKSVVPLRKSNERFAFFSKVKTDDDDDCGAKTTTPVCVNVYDLTPMNQYLYWAGLGIFHSGVEVHGVEYAFGAHDYPSSGVFEVEPRQCPGFRFRKSIFVGTTSMDAAQVREFMERQAAGYNGDTYHLIAKNCNHFCRDICHKLTGERIPKWINRLAKLGSAFNCVLPRTLKATTEAAAPSSSEKRRLTGGGFGGLSSISYRERHMSASSLLLRHPLKGCLPKPPWEFRKSNS